MSDHEVCICAAVRSGPQLVRCQRHFHGLMVLGEVAAKCAEQGFITSRNRFVDREEGLRLQLAAGVASISDGGYRGNLLFSEDLY